MERYITIQEWMLQLGITGNELLVFAVIFGFSQDMATEYKGGYKWLADLLQISKNTVINALASLEEKKLIIKRTENNNGVISNRYSINPDFGTPYQKLVGGDYQKLVEGTTKNWYQNIYKGNNKEKISSLSPSEYKYSSVDNFDISQKVSNQTAKIPPYSYFLKRFNEICTSLPKCLKLSDSRKEMIKKRWEEYGDDVFKVFEKAQASDFISGRNGVWSGANFDWVMKSSNFLKILEGTYDNERYKPEIKTTIYRNIKAAKDFDPGSDWKSESMDF